MARRAFGQKRSVDPRLIMAAAGVACFAAAHWVSADTIDEAQLPAGLNGSGVNVAIVEADSNPATTPDWYEVSPAAVTQPASKFTYIDSGGGVSSTYSTTNHSANHADPVGDNFFGNDMYGVAPGVNHIDDYDAGYFINTLIPNSIATQNNDVVINQSFADPNVSDEPELDYYYDLYVRAYPSTIIVSGAGGATNPYTPEAPGTAYNGISVNPAGMGGNGVTGPAADGLQDPDISAYANNTSTPDASYATPMVSGSAAILVQAGAAGYGGSLSSTETAAQDPRVVKALLMNGAVKPSGWSTGVTSTSPLNSYYGAGVLNIYNSFVNLENGLHSYVASSTQSAGTSAATYPTPAAGSSTDPMAGWILTSVTTTSTNSSIQHYVIPTSGSGSETFTANMNWWSQPTADDPTYADPINNIFLYLYDVTTSTGVAESISTADNLQEIYATVNAGNTYDLMVMKQGGIPGVTAGVISNSDTYALAWSVPEPASFSLCLIGLPLLAARRRRKTCLPITQG
ncbi:MAG: PEP-CTERM sorting domain-containing protein [Tepidisphaeraceae bacterium]